MPGNSHINISAAVISKSGAQVNNIVAEQIPVNAWDQDALPVGNSCTCLIKPMIAVLWLIDLIFRQKSSVCLCVHSVLPGCAQSFLSPPPGCLLRQCGGSALWEAGSGLAAWSSSPGPFSEKEINHQTSTSLLGINTNTTGTQ